MSQLTLTVDGRPYSVSCADGEEDHIRGLAAIIDGKIAQLGGALPAGDPKALLFAALFLADEAEEARRGANSGGADSSAVLEHLADRLEALAENLESSRQAS